MRTHVLAVILKILDVRYIIFIQKYPYLLRKFRAIIISTCGGGITLNAGGAQVHVNNKAHQIWRRSGGIKTFGGGIFFAVKNGVEE